MAVFIIKQFLKGILLPPTPWILLLVLTLIFWQRRWARKLLLGATVLIVLLHSPYLERLLRYPLESGYPPLTDPRAAEPYDAIVVLMGGTVSAGGLIPFPTIDKSTFQRLNEAWRLYRLDPKPIIVTGGHVDPFTPPMQENQIALDFLLAWGLPGAHLIPEPDARDTFENAVGVQKILRERGWTRYLLVTSAVHMPRSLLVFQAIAPGAIPAPADFTVGAGGFSPLSLFPSEDAAWGVAASLHEYLGMVNYYWRVRFSGR